jgi:hypothetical protein
VAVALVFAVEIDMADTYTMETGDRHQSVLINALLRRNCSYGLIPAIGGFDPVATACRVMIPEGAVPSKLLRPIAIIDKKLRHENLILMPSSVFQPAVLDVAIQGECRRVPYSQLVMVGIPKLHQSVQ